MNRSLIALTLAVMVAGCVNANDSYYDPELQAHLEAEREFHAHMAQVYECVQTEGCEE